MYRGKHDRTSWMKGTVALLTLVALLLAVPASAGKDKKKKDLAEKPKKNMLEVLDYSKIVWPNPPAVTRIKYVNFFSGEKYKEKKDKKVSWKDRLAGVAAGEQLAVDKPRFQLVTPYGMAVDSKDRLYIADWKVRAIFIVNPDKPEEFEMIKHGVHAQLIGMVGLAIDDSDRLFVSDAESRRVVVFGRDRKPEATISEGITDPGGIAVDNENRFLYVTDAGVSQVLVFDADPPYKLLRRIGHGGKDFTITDPEYFAKPTNVAVDDDGNVYISDTLNNRIQIFDADGNFVRMFGKPGDGPGYFARPKGIAIDGDGHIWVADTVQDRVQVFSPEGRLLIWMGGHGLYPGQFRTVVGLAIDKKNRVFTSEQYTGRVQFFQYINDAEAKAEKDKRDAEQKNKSANARGKESSAALPPKSSAQ